jgi:hypothetical protein
MPDFEIEVGGVYTIYNGELVKVLKLDKDRNEMVLYNISDSHKMWVSYDEKRLKKRIR